MITIADGTFSDIPSLVCSAHSSWLWQ